MGPMAILQPFVPLGNSGTLPDGFPLVRSWVGGGFKQNIAGAEKGDFKF